MTPADWRDSLRSLIPDDYQPEPEPAAPERAPFSGLLTITVDRKRAGKVATIISGFGDDEQTAAEVCSMLRRSMAVGGSARGGEVLVQGDRAEKARQLLRQAGYKVK